MLLAIGVKGVTAEVFTTVMSFIILVASLGTGAVAYVYTHLLLSGTEPVGSVGELRDVAAEVGRNLPSLVGVFVLYNIAVFVGSLLFVLPGLYLAVRLLLAFPACVLEDQGPLKSLSISWEAAQGNLLKIGGLVVIILLLWFVALIVSLLLSTFDGVFIAVLRRALVMLVVAVSFGAFQMALARVYLENQRPGSTQSSSGSKRQGRPASADNCSATSST